jgi:hypothetical protein
VKREQPGWQFWDSVGVGFLVLVAPVALAIVLFLPWLAGWLALPLVAAGAGWFAWQLIQDHFNIGRFSYRKRK